MRFCENLEPRFYFTNTAIVKLAKMFHNSVHIERVCCLMSPTKCISIINYDSCQLNCLEEDPGFSPVYHFRRGRTPGQNHRHSTVSSIWLYEIIQEPKRFKPAVSGA